MLFRPSRKGRKRQKKGGKGRFRPISGKGGQTPLKPPFVTPPFATAQVIFLCVMVMVSELIRMTVAVTDPDSNFWS